MLYLFTDFGWNGPYVGQLHAVLQSQAPTVPVIDLMHDAPVFNPKASAYLLNALRQQFPVGSIFLAVVDPGVGNAQRFPVVIQADGQWFIGPDNGLFEVIAQTATQLQCWQIAWRPEKLSASFHGRDLFAPVAAALARGDALAPWVTPLASLQRQGWNTDLHELIYIDQFGNCMTGIRAAACDRQTIVRLGIHECRYARTYSEVPAGMDFWYENSIGLLELASNQGNFAARHHCHIGQGIAVLRK